MLCLELASWYTIVEWYFSVVADLGAGMQGTQMQNARRLRVSPDKIGKLGDSIADVDGVELSVFGGIPGELVEVEVLNERRDRSFGRVVEVVETSRDRVAAPCPYFGPCTGCQWQHISYERQLEFKRNFVAEALHRHGLAQAVVTPTLSSPDVYGYRNHARFTVGKGGRLGFINRNTRQFVAVDQCRLMHPWINRALAELQGHCQETTQVSIRYGEKTGEWLIQPLLLDPAIPLGSGQKYYTEKIKNREFRIAAPSFFRLTPSRLIAW